MAQHRHKRETPATRSPVRPAIPRSVLVSAPLAVVATLSAVTMGVLGRPQPGRPPATDLAAASSGSAPSIASRSPTRAPSRAAARPPCRGPRSAPPRRPSRPRARTSRSTSRHAASAKKLDDSLWTTEALNLWDGPSEKSEKIGEVDAIKQVAVTGREQIGRTQVVIDGQSRWVTADYLVADKPKPEPDGPEPGRRLRQRLLDLRRPRLALRDPRRGVRQLARDHQLRHVAGRRRARPGPRDRHHGQRRDRLGRSPTSCAPTTPRWASSTSSSPSTSGPWSAPARAGAACPTAGRRPPTTTTTCTSRSTDARRRARRPRGSLG